MKRLAYIAVVLALATLAWYVIAHRRAQAANQLPRTLKEFKQRPGGGVTVEAGDFLIALAKEGKLPGFSAGEHGTMHAGIVDGNANAASAGTQEAYPVSRGIHFSKEGDTSDYFYVVACESPGSPWKLKKAWRMDAGGRLVENYPIP